AGTCGHTLCAGTSADAVGALWPNSPVFPYPDERPWEVSSPKGKPREDAQQSSPGAIKTPMRRLPASLSPTREQDTEQNGLRSASWKETSKSIRLWWRSSHDRKRRRFPDRCQEGTSVGLCLLSARPLLLNAGCNGGFRPVPTAGKSLRWLDRMTSLEG